MIPIEHQIISYEDEPLENRSKLSNCGITTGAILHLHVNYHCMEIVFRTDYRFVPNDLVLVELKPHISQDEHISPYQRQPSHRLFMVGRGIALVVNARMFAPRDPVFDFNISVGHARDEYKGLIEIANGKF